MIKLYYAPMEGVTTYVYRRLHSEMFGGADKYFSPFIAPDRDGNFKSSRLRDILPENNGGIKLVPQVLANSAEAFLRVARQLADMGYDEVNLNAGCPSGTVVAKHKGAGMLTDLRSLDIFLADVFSRTPISVSVKTRVGFSSPEEFAAILEIYSRYPISELSVHARVREAFYGGAPELEAFELALEARGDAIYNGSIYTPADFCALRQRFPTLGGVMIGRGAAANPALFRQLCGGAALELRELREFHAALIGALLSEGLSPSFAAARMKELWYYLISLFPDSTAQYKALRKTAGLDSLRACAESIFAQCSFCPDAGFAEKK